MSAVAAASGASFGVRTDGSRLIDDGRALSQAIRNGDWLKAGSALLDTLGSAAGALTDPIGTIASCGLGWIMEHLKPLSTWLEKLTGSEANVASVSRQWSSAGQTLRETGTTLNTRLNDLEGLQGGTVTSYVRFASDLARHLDASGEWADAAAHGLTSASTLVTKMQGIVKEAISKVVATAIEAMAVVAASLGLGMGYAIARVVTKVHEMVNKVVKPLTQVVQSVTTLTSLVRNLGTLFEGTSTKVDGMLRTSPTTVSLIAGPVVDASGATAYGATAFDDFTRRAAIADAVDHRLTPVAGGATIDAYGGPRGVPSTFVLDGLSSHSVESVDVARTVTVDGGTGGLDGRVSLGGPGAAGAGLLGGGASGSTSGGALGGASGGAGTAALGGTGAGLLGGAAAGTRLGGAGVMGGAGAARLGGAGVTRLGGAGAARLAGTGLGGAGLGGSGQGGAAQGRLAGPVTSGAAATGMRAPTGAFGPAASTPGGGAGLRGGGHGAPYLPGANPASTRGRASGQRRGLPIVIEDADDDLDD
jgi:hypothetical protein